MEILRKCSLLGLLCIFACASKKTNPESVRMIISDLGVKSNSFINVTIYNDTKENIYLPLDTSSLGEDRDTFGGVDEERFFLVMKNVEQTTGAKWIPVIAPCDEFDYIDMIMDKWDKKIKNLKVKDMILVKKGDSTSFKIPFKLRHERIKDCYYEYIDYQNFKNGEYQVYLSYNLISKFEHTFLQPSLIDSLSTMGYKIYNGKLISNKAPLLTNN